MQRIHTITLDLDDTLWPIMPVIQRAERMLWEFLESRYPRVPESFDRNAAARLRESVIAENQDRAHDLRFLRRTVLARMAETCGYAAQLVDEAFTVFDEQRNIVELFPDVQSALQQLRGSYRLVALTNGNASLERIGIRHLFDDVITAIDAGAAKPAPQIFEYARERTGAAADELLHVGDHPHFDIEGARAVGMRTAWVNRRGEEWPAGLPRPDATVTCMQQLADFLQPYARPRDARR